MVTDWLMPGLDGLDLCRCIRAEVDVSYTYIVLVTSLEERDHIRTGMGAGADDYLVKPLDPFALETRLIAARRVTSLHAEMTRYREELSRQAHTDPLTQLRNRLSLDDDLAAVHAQSHRYGHGYSVAMCDVDSFKSYNDTYGHQAGDEALRTVAATLSANVRAADIVYRIGGEEFLILFPEQTLWTAGMAAERLRVSVESLGLPHPGGGPSGVVTVSLGVAGSRGGDGGGEGGTTVEALLAHADEAMYGAKAKGRNQVILSG